MSDGSDILFEYDSASVLQARYTHGPGIDEPLIMDRGGQSYCYHADGLGSVTELSDSTGTVVQAYLYDSYGNIIQMTGTLVNPFTYTGRERDNESGLFYYRARYYDANTGRFLQEDPIGFAGLDINLYRYVRNNPINFIDPNGRKILTAPLCVAAAAGLGLVQASQEFDFLQFLELEKVMDTIDEISHESGDQLSQDEIEELEMIKLSLENFQTDSFLKAKPRLEAIALQTGYISALCVALAP